MVRRADFGAAGFLAAACAGPAVGVGRGEGNGAVAGVEEAGERGGVGAVPGSGAMMLTAGVEAAVGNSALVGLPVGIEGASIATGADVAAGAFHDGA